jgi:hypothetical protein
MGRRDASRASHSAPDGGAVSGSEHRDERGTQHRAELGRKPGAEPLDVGRARGLAVTKGFPGAREARV